MNESQKTYEQLAGHVRQTHLLATASSLLEWDEQTYLPPAGAEYRAEQLTLLAGMVHARRTAPEVGDWLAELVESPLAADPGSVEGCNIRELARQYERKRRLPQRLVEELARTASLGHQTWVEARRDNNYAHFQPLLGRMFALKREEADALGYEETRYDALLDDYEPHTTTRQVSEVLENLGKELVPLVDKITGSTRQAPREILERHYPTDRQARFGQEVAKAIGFDFDSGRLDVTAHPFCTTLGPADVRLTTRYHEHLLGSGLFSILHEAGHGLYEQGLPSDQFALPAGDAISLGIHESQSRMWENLVGLSRPFWEHFYPQLQQTFPESLGGTALDDFHFAANDSRPSLIRVEADEATYNLHILVRFELEQQLLDDDLPLDELPGAWNAAYEKYLGITPPNDAQGVLQDVHWSAGLIGYFPTYALGNLYACQFFATAASELGDLDGLFRRGDFAPLLEWLRQKIHRVGQRASATALVEQVTGSRLGSEPLLRHLTEKFGPLYGF